MKLAVSEELILKLLKHQLANFFMLDKHEEIALDEHFARVLVRCESCFSQNTNSYYKREGEVYFNPYHSVQYMTFLYYFSNTLYRNDPENMVLCDKLYYLNKALNSVDLLYAVELPDFFTAEHPVGSVIGRARIGNGFVFFQNCTVGGVEREGAAEVYPVIGEQVHLYANSSVIGDCRIGDHVSLGAGTLVKNQNIPDNSVVFGQSPNIIIKSKK